LPNTKFSLPPKDEQRRIAEILWAADKAIEKYKFLLVQTVNLRTIFVSFALNDRSSGNLSDLSSASVIEMGQSPPGHSYNTNFEGYPLLNGPTEFGEIYPIPEQWTNDPKRFAENGDILFCVRGSTTGRQNMADRKYAIGRGLAAIRGKEGKSVTPYIKILLEALTDQVFREAQGAGSTFPNITSKRLKELQVPIPTLEIQEKLSEEFNSISVTQRNIMYHISVLTELKSTLLNELIERHNVH
jgi:type I restriction enzyme, S subunit